MNTSYRYFHAGELFTLTHLQGNLALSDAISVQSNTRYTAILPQDLGTDKASGQSIRDADLLALLSSDVALFNFDGAELDSGTVVEFIFAKFADIPSVILRTDFRRSGDASEDPWNLMLGKFPRTENVLVHAMEIYQQYLAKKTNMPSSHIDPVQASLTSVATQIIDAFDRVKAMSPVIPTHLREAVYEWLAYCPNFQIGSEQASQLLKDFLKSKVESHLI
jgi:nucleoside 2-deoxyribosyltransferase